MKLLLDTHTFLWSMTGSHLSERARATFLNRENRLFLSAASYWEICIKIGIGKLALAANWPQVFEEEIAANGIQWLPIEKEHSRKVIELPLIHRDPFDRLLVAQALCEDMTILTADSNIQSYAVTTLW
ncbi:MAG: type II toxin-antitoxin system VapC family toxin [Anaerolineae bacterium]|nr:type II toxin-antitoxin system VapC family toxin [Anaerolineae bacterium]